MTANPYLSGNFAPVEDELTALENLRFAATMYGIVADKDRMVEALAHVGLEHVADAEPGMRDVALKARVARLGRRHDDRVFEIETAKLGDQISHRTESVCVLSHQK